MSEGPTPISGAHEGAHDREQVRPSFHVGGWYVSLGDTVTGWHRVRKLDVRGTVILFAGCLCISTPDGIFPIQRIAIHTLTPPDPRQGFSSVVTNE